MPSAQQIKYSHDNFGEFFAKCIIVGCVIGSIIGYVAAKVLA